MMSAPTSRRQRCDRCQRPVSHCVCSHIPSLDSRTRVLVLQHPDEVRHPLNTARLAVLGLKNAELKVGEQFEALPELIAAAGRALLLFPAREGTAVSAPELAAVGDTASKPNLLIVPDGTWRKARKIVQANPVLDGLPRLTLPEGEPSRYRVRKARGPGAVSTIEAIVRALAQLEPDRDFRPLLKPFDALIDQQISAMGDEVFERNHVGVGTGRAR